MQEHRLTREEKAIKESASSKLKGPAKNEDIKSSPLSSLENDELNIPMDDSSTLESKHGEED